MAGIVAVLGLAACSIGGGGGGGGGGTSAAGQPSAGVTPHHARAHKRSVTVTAVGDTMLGYGASLPPDPGHYFSAVHRQLTAGAQIVFGNLEGTLTTASTSKCGPKSKPGTCFAFSDPPDYAHYLKAGGFTVLNDANNHSFDFGSAGQAQTVQAIHGAGLAQTGLPGEITVVRAHRVKVAFVAFAPYDYTASLLDIPAAQALIRKAAGEAPIVVVYMHVGAEGSGADHVTGQEEIFLGEDRGNPGAFAHMAIRAGASLVIASGPHVLRGMQFYRRHLIAYSLGNFAGYGNFATEGDLGLSAILRVRLSATGRFERARLDPVEFAGKGQPVPGGGTVAFVAGLSRDDFGATAARIGPSGVIRAPAR
jgi:poly-gamma-glutamate capsule biosynthesis protein CapA/YwtB (metallophosphatase superfamily)